MITPTSLQRGQRIARVDVSHSGPGAAAVKPDPGTHAGARAERRPAAASGQPGGGEIEIVATNAVRRAAQSWLCHRARKLSGDGAHGCYVEGIVVPRVIIR